MPSNNVDQGTTVVGMTRRVGGLSSTVKGIVRGGSAPAKATRSSPARSSSSTPNTSTVTVARSRIPMVANSKNEENVKLLKASDDFVSIPTSGIAFRGKVGNVKKKRAGVRDSQGSIQSNRSQRSSRSNTSNRSASFDLSADNETSIRNDVRKAVVELRDGRVASASSAATDKRKPISSFATGVYTRSVVSSGYGNNNVCNRKIAPPARKSKKIESNINKIASKNGTSSTSSVLANRSSAPVGGSKRTIGTMARPSSSRTSFR